MVRQKEMKPAKCSECGEEFETSKLLLDHRNSKHVKGI